VTLNPDSHPNLDAVHAGQFCFRPHLVKFGINLLQLPFNTRLQFLGMEPIQNEQAADEWILAKLIYSSGARITRLEHNFQNSLQPGSVQVHQKLHEFFRRSSRRRIRNRFHVMHETADFQYSILEFFFVDHNPP
jgi:hypothetical protein